ncbi:MAG: paraquat-inducible protein A [Pseudomonadota bacterium]
MTADVNSNLIACPSCDQLYDVSDMHYGEKATCSRCGHLLTRVRESWLQKLQAYSIAGLVCLAISCAFPFMSFESSGITSIMTLPQTVQQLYDQGRPDLAFLVAAFILVIPGVVLFLLVLLSTCMLRERFYPWMIPTARLVFHLQSWAMVEVFFIGVLVSLVKIAHMATVVIGISFWGYAAFFLLFIAALACIDPLQYWNRMERLAGAQSAV